MDIAVVGSGRVGTALAVWLRAAGHRIVGVSGRDATADRVRRYLPSAPLLPAETAARRAEVVLIGAPDAAIEPACAALVAVGALTTGTAVGHLSGATSVSSLDAAASIGATTFSIHPLQTFPSVEAALDRLPGCPFAITSASDAGLALGEVLALDAGGRPFRLDDRAKPLYHAAAVFASNYLVTVTALAERVASAAGLVDPLELLAPLQRATLENVHDLGPGDALTGPAVRGDAGTVEANIAGLSASVPAAVAAYVVLARAAMDLGERAGHLSPGGRAAVEEVLERWT
jgi:predicted short-subunit dehydrogenase-like oxidoreductase (DUF2520 family)